MYFLLCCHFRIFRSPLGFLPALQVHLHFAAACHAFACFFVLAALRMNGVVPLSLLSEDRDLHVLQQARLLTLEIDRKSTRLNSSHRCISYAVFCLKKKSTCMKHLHTQ